MDENAVSSAKMRKNNKNRQKKKTNVYKNEI